MLRRLLIGTLWAVPAYLLGAFGGGYVVYLTSSNQHDPSVEASMTGAFILGPLAGGIGFLVGTLRAQRPPQRPGFRVDE
jgi:uncharacterized membrane protein